jgi:hypothetical protein
VVLSRRCRTEGGGYGSPHRFDRSVVCRDRAVSTDLSCVKWLIFNMRNKCFRAGLVSGKLLTQQTRFTLGAPDDG